MEIKSLIAIISLLLSVIGTVITRYLSVKEKKYLESNSLTDEIENLDNISENLKNLQKFISIQKNNLIMKKLFANIFHILFYKAFLIQIAYIHFVKSYREIKISNYHWELNLRPNEFFFCPNYS